MGGDADQGDHGTAWFLHGWSPTEIICVPHDQVAQVPHCHDWDGHSGRDSRIASPCRYPGRDLTGTLAVGQDVANLLAKHLLYRTSAFRYAIRESWFGICKAPGPMHTCALQREARSEASLALLCLTKRKWQWSTCLSTCSCSAPSWRVCCWVAKCRSECLERRTKIQKRISGKISTFVWAMKSTSKLQRPAPTLLRLVRECWWTRRWAMERERYWLQP